jgi:pimeloyl-ACP methyl ester carboxylesterase
MGSSSWAPIASSLREAGTEVLTPDRVGYGHSPAPSSGYGIGEEVCHLERQLGLEPRPCNDTVYTVGPVRAFHLVMHSLGSLIGFHLRRALGPRATRMTIVEPVVVSI